MENTTVEICLSGKHGKGKTTTVDKKYEITLTKRPIYFDNTGRGYAYTKKDRKKVYLHQLVMLLEGIKGGNKLQIDHKDGNKLNNTVSNLRFATREENQSNRGLSKSNKSGYKGVQFRKDRGCYAARMKIKTEIGTRNLCLGHFKTAKEAAIAYNKKLQERKDIREEFKVYNDIE